MFLRQGRETESLSASINNMSSARQDDDTLDQTKEELITAIDDQRLQTLLRRKQITRFLFTYLLNFVAILGFSVQFTTSTFKFKDTAADNYSDVQAMLFSSAVMYFLVGMTLEYTKRSDILILTILLLFAALKISKRPQVEL